MKRIFLCFIAILFFSVHVNSSFADVDSTQVLTPAGYVPVQNLKTGDLVVGIDSSTGLQIINTVQSVDVVTPAQYNYWEQDSDGTYTNYVELPFTFYRINGEYKLFQDQSVVVNDRVIHAHEIQLGDSLKLSNGQTITIQSVVPENDSESNWIKLSVSGNHTYIADGLLLHNASRYWVGGGSSVNWNATANTNWGSASNTRDNASVPGTSDAVIFDGVGFGASNSTISASITVNSIDMTGYTNTLTHNAGVTLTVSGNVFKLASGMTYTLGNTTTSAVSFTSTTGTSGTPTTINTNGKTLGNITVNGANGYFSLQNNATSTGTFTLTAGTFDANNFNFSNDLLSSSNSNVRSLKMGSGVWTLTGSGTVWNTGTLTNMTLNSGSSTLVINNSTASTKTISTGSNYSNQLYNVEFAGSGTGGLIWSSSYYSYLNNFTVTNTGSAPITYPTTTCFGGLSLQNLSYIGYTGTATNNCDLIVAATSTFSSGMTWAGSGVFTFNKSLILNPGMNITYTGLIQGVDTSNIVQTLVIDTAGKTLNGNMLLLTSSGTYSLSSDLTMASSTYLSLTTKNLDFNDKNVTIGSFISTSPYDRYLYLGSGTTTITGTGTVWNSVTDNNQPAALIIYPETSTVVFAGTNQTIVGSNTFNNLTKISTSSDTLKFGWGNTQTILGTLTLQGDSTSTLSLRSNLTQSYPARSAYGSTLNPRSVVGGGY